MNDIDLCLEVVYVNYCVTFAIELSEKPLEIEASKGPPPDRQMDYEESSGYVTDDITWPWKVKLVPSISLEPNISKTAGDAVYKQSLLELIVCCETVRSAILVRAWILVMNSSKREHFPILSHTSIVGLDLLKLHDCL